MELKMSIQSTRFDDTCALEVRWIFGVGASFKGQRRGWGVNRTNITCVAAPIQNGAARETEKLEFRRVATVVDGAQVGRNGWSHRGPDVKCQVASRQNLYERGPNH